MLGLPVDCESVGPFDLRGVDVRVRGGGLAIEVEGAVVGGVGVARIPLQRELEDLRRLGKVVLVDRQVVAEDVELATKNGLQVSTSKIPALEAWWNASIESRNRALVPASGSSNRWR